MDPAELINTVVLARVRLQSGEMLKGTLLNESSSRALVASAANGGLNEPVKLAWIGPDQLHENEASRRLAAAVSGRGIQLSAPHQSRVNLVASHAGVLHVDVAALTAVNRLDPLEVFTLYDGTAVRAAQVVASTKVAPHLVNADVIEQAERLAGQSPGVVEVRPYRSLEVGALVMERVPADHLARFESAIRGKLESLGSRLKLLELAVSAVPAENESLVLASLHTMAVTQRLPLVLVAGVSAGDPLAPFFRGLERAGGRMIRHGVPAHPGSMIWLARVEETQILGLPGCGMFSMATAADLLLPRLLTGEVLSADSIAGLGHGGLLTREIRFRFPDYAQRLESPDAE